MPPDPYQTLGVTRNASDAELRAAYRRLVQLHHPDHNGGSAESARRFEEVQDAYARIRALRDDGVTSPPPRSGRPPDPGQARQSPPPPRGQTPPDPNVESRIEQMERELREAQQARAKAQKAREEAQRAARAEAAAASGDESSPRRPSDEELGYVKTDDSFAKIFSDAEKALEDRLSGARERPVTKRAADLLDGLARKLGGGGRPPSK